MPQDFEFELPFPARVSPDVEAARDRSVAWARRLGLIVHPLDEERVRSWDIAGLMAGWVPTAAGAELDLTVDAVVTATALDDQFDSPLGNRPDEVTRVCAEMTTVIMGEGAPTTPLGHALADAWARFTAQGSALWLARARRHWGWYLAAYMEESGVRATNIVLPPDQFFALRRRSGFVYAMLDMSELACGFEIDQRIRRSASVRRMLEITADVIDTLNDVHSLEKEESRGDPHNLVLVLEHEHGWSRSRSLSEIRKMLYSWSAEFQDESARLPHSRDDTTDLTDRLIGHMRDAMAGYLAWSRTVPRYAHLVPPHEPAYPTPLV